MLLYTGYITSGVDYGFNDFQARLVSDEACRAKQVWFVVGRSAVGRSPPQASLRRHRHKYLSK
ncbi:hypothetical protein DPMN_150782 [Dreissena polymorpha]|uniref:Uncharacterized protein n=1 Tax=Dreissena polymorpha TaxID=45954 RepID=A0A9D4FFY9_DREPO|nr:hypothetical protein DPMN_150782 [Dreissena polymorpha]